MSPNPMPPIPALFLERMKRLLGDEFAAFATALEENPVSGLRVNTLKLAPEEFRVLSPFRLGERVEWCDSAFTLNPNPGASAQEGRARGSPLRASPTPSSSGRGEPKGEPGKHPYHLAGLYYLQDPSAMSAAPLLDPRPGERVLDLAAAPGGKTTALAALMQGSGLLVANEIKDKRLGHLAVNVERWGAGNVVITNETPERLADHFGAFFDRVLVDAPCSGEGMFRKEASARLDWSPEMVAGCAIRQRNILRVAAKLVRPGGHLLYSTCTFAPEENEQVIANFLVEFQEYAIQPLDEFSGFMHGRPDWVGPAKDQSQDIQQLGLEKAVRLFPQRVSGEGHFACLMKRAGPAEAQADWNSDRLAHPTRAQERLWQAFVNELLNVDFAADRLRVRAERLYFTPEKMPDFGNLRVVHPGVWLGTFKKERFEPAHPLALFLKRGQARNVLDLSSSGATSRSPLQAYLGGESIPSDGPAGWTLVSVDGWPLGWGKRVQGMLKNHYPKGWQVYS
jgi:16S rRNA C967 or C1407 C5-methylase (RsmB/RsmF family)/NOL1/NOP2/fmu family ribosome biogenesis protein